MNATEYQKQAARTLIDKPDFTVTNLDLDWIRDGINLGILAGAVCEQLKKGILHRHGLNLDQYKVGLWQVAEKANWIKARLGWLSYPKQQEPAPDHDVMLVWNVIGLLGEAAEVANVVLCALVTGQLDRGEFAKELGDLLWYAAALCTKLGIDLGAVMQLNIEKLKERYPDGWDAARSKAHVAPGLFIMPAPAAAQAPAYLPNQQVETITPPNIDL